MYNHLISRLQFKAVKLWHRLKSGLTKHDWQGLEVLEDRLLLSGDLIINEILAANQSALADDDGDFSDFIELFNPTADAVDLSGWYLSDDPIVLDKWQLPDVSLASNDYMIIFASKKNRAVAGQTLHTNFNLDGAGESVLLVQPDGVTVASSIASFPPQRADVSYGRTFSTVAQEVVIEKGAEWKYLDDGSDQGTLWAAAGFDDSAWSAGNAQLGYGDGDETTPVGFGADANHKHITTYFRRSFEVSDLSSVTSLVMRILRDDGAVVHINGVEAERPNMLPGLVDFETVAQSSVGNADESAFYEFELDIDLLVEGVNSIAVEIHQHSRMTSDLSFDLELELQRISAPHDGFMLTPTPNGPNGAGVNGFVADTKFSTDRGFFDAAFDLEITTETSGAVIKFTLDGSAPSETHGTVYSAPISIATTTTLRAIAFKPEFLSTNIDTQSYIFLEDVLQQPIAPAGLPSIWDGQAQAPINADYEVDPDIVNNPAYRNEILSGLRDIPSISIVMDPSDLFGASDGIYINSGQRGAAWERPTSVEIIETDGSTFQVDSGVRIHGFSWRFHRNTPKHSLRLEFRDEFGPSKLEYPLFPNSPVDKFDSIVLRAQGGRSWGGTQNPEDSQYQRDTFARDLGFEMGRIDGHATYVHLYLNGLYWGLYNPVERPDAQFAEEHFGGTDEDYDALNRRTSTNEAIDGDLQIYNQMIALASSTLATGTTTNDDLAEFERYLAMDEFIDFFILNQYVTNRDGLTAFSGNNQRAIGSRVGDPQFRFFVWDMEYSLWEATDNNNIDAFRNDPPLAGSQNPQGHAWNVYMALRQNPEFRLRYADRVQEHLFNDGALTPQRATEIWEARAESIERAIIAESARWGDVQRPTNPYTRDGEWQTERNRLLTEYFPQRTDILVGQLREAGLFTNIDAPVFNQHGGRVSSGFELHITNVEGSGDVYFTLDSTDPRLAGGAISPSALLWDGTPIVITDNVIVTTRTLDGADWSAKDVGDFRINAPASSDSLTITELSYRPSAPTTEELTIDPSWTRDAFQFVELLNASNEPLDLIDVRFDDGITFTFTGSDVTTLGAGQHVVVVKNISAYLARYGTGAQIAGEFTGRLNDNGEAIRIVDAVDQTIVDFTYDNNGTWPGRADGKGSSLERVNLTGDLNDSANWRSSSEFGGSPGYAGVGADNRVVVNEVLAHTDLPLIDSIELLNTTNEDINIGGWYLSDSSDDYLKFRIPDNTIVTAGDYLVFDETNFNSSGNALKDFALDSAHGDDVYLVEAELNATNTGGLRGFVDHVDFGASKNGESFGRVPNGAGQLTPLLSRSMGTANGDPRVGPVIFSELMYKPADPGNLPIGVVVNDLEFVEVFNPTLSSVDLTNWALDKAVDFVFPADLMLSPQQTLLILAFDPDDPLQSDKVTAFECTFNVSLATLNVVGGFQGQLNNGGDKLQLHRPDEPPAEEPDFFPMLHEDEVKYDNALPWPSGADGLGDSLHRVAIDSFGNRPESWRAATASPGSVDFETDTTPPQVTNIVYNGGDDQRSTLTTVAITFSEDVSDSLLASDLQLLNVTTSTFINAVDLQMSWNDQQHIAKWMFPNFEGLSLADGNYELLLRSQDVTDAAGNHLDTSGDGQGSGNANDDWSSTLWRYFGDGDGDRDVDSFDLFGFRTAFNTGNGHANYNANFDIANDGDIDSADLFAFRQQLFTKLDPPLLSVQGEAGQQALQSQQALDPQQLLLMAKQEPEPGNAGSSNNTINNDAVLEQTPLDQTNTIDPAITPIENLLLAAPMQTLKLKPRQRLLPSITPIWLDESDPDTANSLAQRIERWRSAGERITRLLGNATASRDFFRD